MTRPKILAIGALPFYSAGKRTFEFGLSIFNEQLFPALARMGHRVRVLAEAPPKDGKFERTAIEWDAPNLTVEPFALEFRNGQLPSSASFRAAHQRRCREVFDRAMHEERPDVVVIGRESLALHFGDIIRGYGSPWIIVAHGVPTAGLLEEGFPSDFRDELIAQMGSSDLVVTVAHHLAVILLRLGVARVRTISNVVDPVRFHPQPKDRGLLNELRIAPDQTVVGHISDLSTAKRPFDVVESALRVLEQEPRAVYVVCGDGHERPALEKFCSDKGIASSFRFVGAVEHRDVDRYMNLADVVLSSSGREGCPLTYLEALACGRVLLASDIPAAHEMIADGGTGMFYNMGDPVDLAAKTLTLIREPNLRSRLGGAARCAAERMSVARWAESYSDAITEVAAT
ncbi:MAG TPA: glycosyltransferase family 4 protein [Candidatus Binataceae bacterium]|nr:glycosyltransferase family 4 protein [Candidatus Binataceae bacterium]